MNVNEENTQPYMQSLSSLLNKLQHDGYTEDFRVTTLGLQAPGNDEKFWTPADVKVVNFYRFEGPSSPEDEEVVYVLETADGVKGTLTDAYGPNADPYVTEFLKDFGTFPKKGSHS
ncbi:MAG: hypothetical protein EOO11_18740 [Chitinophagaceae bacterium]|nr:MAG: hypothetical protein EOO11_18740 [Chitinophagaceae bacterium]